MARPLPGRALKVLLSPLPQRSIIERFTIALLTAALAVLLRWFLDPVLGHVAFYVTVYMAVAFSAFVCGAVPAVLSALVGFCGIFYWFVDPRHSLSLARQSEIHGMVGFFLVCTVLIALGEANRRKQLRLNETIAALTTEGDERERAELELQKAHDQLEQRVAERTVQLSQALASVESEASVRKQAEEQLRRLSVRLMTLQDEERRRIARDLHDTTGQALAAIKMTLALIQQIGTSVPNFQGLVDDLNALADEALQEIRTTSYLLHPPLLDESGIASAARWFVEGFAKRSGIQVHCDIPEKMERLPRNCELVLFRVLQEGLTNVHRYSGASAATVRLRLENNELEFEVSDNGSGISEERLQQVREAGGSAGVGIAGMRERVRELSGSFEIQSSKSGTAVRVTLPISKASVSTEAGIGVPAA
jgi:signal transduction histidine kinase